MNKGIKEDIKILKVNCENLIISNRADCGEEKNYNTEYISAMNKVIKQLDVILENKYSVKDHLISVFKKSGETMAFIFVGIPLAICFWICFTVTDVIKKIKDAVKTYVFLEIKRIWSV